MTKIFFDTEFTGLHQNTTLISIGLIAESGETFYAELIDYDETQVDNWIRENVVSKLHLKESVGFKDDTKHLMFKCNKEELKKYLERWFIRFDKVEMWSDCLSYDWVLFCQLFGHAFKVPSNVYYIPF